jgi:hypothetical protein
MNTNTLAASLSFAILFSGNLPAHAEVVYSQPTTTDAGDVGLGWYSSSEPRPTRNFRHADNFTLGADTSITSVRWWGLSEGVSHTDLSNFDSFTIEFWTNRMVPNGNIRPRELILSTTLNVKETNTTETGRAGASGALEYVHEAALGEAVELLGGEIYWVSISASSIDPSADVWQWQDSDDFDTLSSSFDYGQNRWVVLEDTDSAFELIAVPSPGSVGVLAMGGLLAQRRRRHLR